MFSRWESVTSIDFRWRFDFPHRTIILRTSSSSWSMGEELVGFGGSTRVLYHVVVADVYMSQIMGVHTPFVRRFSYHHELI